MSGTAAAGEVQEGLDAVAISVRAGLLSLARTLPPWLFYDAAGSLLFEKITELPEYYITRTERALLAAHAEEILGAIAAPVTIVELGAGTATKTGIVLRAAAARQGSVSYQPIDVSASSLEEARSNIEASIAGATVRPSVANYVNDPIRVERLRGHSVLAMYIGSSIGNFSPDEAHAILARLRAQMRRGDHLLLGTDMAPGRGKSIADLIAAYDDAAGMTAAFNRNVLVRLNRELGTDFQPERFEHRAHWNAEESRIEMHLYALAAQEVAVPGNSAGGAFSLSFERGETIHTENSYKFTTESLQGMLAAAGFSIARTFEDENAKFALMLACVAGGGNREISFTLIGRIRRAWRAGRFPGTGYADCAFNLKYPKSCT